MNKKRVCVLGAGISGIVAAYTLKDKGHDVVVFERGRRIQFGDVPPGEIFDDEIGGKCYTKYFHDQAYELGACSVSPGFKTVLKHARRTGARVRDRFPFGVLQSDGTMQTTRQAYWPRGAGFRIMREVFRYWRHTIGFKIRYDKGSTYAPMPEKYTVPFMEFCRRQRMQYVPRFMELPVVSFGYGSLEDIRTWYVLDYINAINWPGLALLLMGLNQVPVKRLDRGYGDLVKRIAEGMDVRHHHEVVDVLRHEPGVTVRVKNLDTGEEFEEAFDKIVIAAPLTDVKDILDRSEEETRLLDSPVRARTDAHHLQPDEAEVVAGTKIKPYAIVAAEIDGLPEGRALLLRENVGEQGHVMLIERTMVDEASALSVCYIPDGAAPAGETQEETRARTLKQLEEDVAVFGGTLGTVHAYKRWNYFPHFVDPGLYRKLAQIQGRRDTYYVGGLTKFELAERCAAQAEFLMDYSFDGEMTRECFTSLRNWFYFYARALPRPRRQRG